MRYVPAKRSRDRWSAAHGRELRARIDSRWQDTFEALAREVRVDRVTLYRWCGSNAAPPGSGHQQVGAERLAQVLGYPSLPVLLEDIDRVVRGDGDREFERGYVECLMALAELVARNDGRMLVRPTDVRDAEEGITHALDLGDRVERSAFGEAIDMLVRSMDAASHERVYAKRIPRLASFLGEIIEKPVPDLVDDLAPRKLSR